MIKFGILGCGRIGQVHARTLRGLDGVAITAVADALPEAAERLAASCGAEMRDVAGIVDGSDIDAVLIGTPTDTHFELIERACAAGKAIFCEKPVDMSVDNIRRSMDRVAAANIPFMTGFNRRFDPNFSTLQARLRAGEIGALEMVIITSRDPAPPPLSYIKSSGGIFRDMMIHDFDMARFLLGEEATHIQAVGAALVDPAIGEAGDVDTAAVTLTTASGRICQISNSRRATYGYDQRIEVLGSDGMLQAGNILETSVIRAGQSGFQSAPTLNFFLERYEAAFRLELQAFVDAIESGQTPSPSIEDGLRAQMMADAATESWQTGQAIEIKAD